MSRTVNPPLFGSGPGTRRALTIRTPEGIVFPLVLASPLDRFLALALDRCCVILVSSVVTVILGLVGILSADLAGACWILSSFIISFGYVIALEWLWRGQTIGKRLLRLQVMDEQGLRLHFSQIVVRNLLRVVDSLPAFYLVGGIAALVGSRGQRIGDLAANTIVIRHPRIAEPDLDQVLPGKYNSFRDHPAIAARLRQNASPGEAGVALQAIARRESLDPDARVRLFRQIRQHAESLAAFPPEATEGLSDEQYVRNVVDILFR
ncbi:MAG: RDD family protein [Lentisphaerae bacterium]|nr:RDD family protein [Lentisphaerota bacterium]